MRPLTEEELEIFFTKLTTFIGRNTKHLVDRSDEPHCFRVHNDRVYYVRESVLKQAVRAGRDEIVAVGTCFGKFTKSNKFRLQITALDYLAQFAKCKVWVKPSAEMSFLYGNHVLKSGLGRITDGTSKYSGVVVMSMADVPLGFGVAAHSTVDCRKLDPTAVVCFNQADCGAYLREEEMIG